MGFPYDTMDEDEDDEDDLDMQKRMIKMGIWMFD
jgi:hypothetical protein